MSLCSQGGIELEKITPIEEAYKMLRQAEKPLGSPDRDDAFSYLNRMCPEASKVIEHIVGFWGIFSKSSIRVNYNFIKRKGALC